MRLLPHILIQRKMVMMMDHRRMRMVLMYESHRCHACFISQLYRNEKNYFLKIFSIIG